MNNPGLDFENWKRLKQKWVDLDASGHKIKVDFKLIADPNDKEKILVIDVIQNIDKEPVTETVQRSMGEAYATLGIAGLSMEHLVELYKEIMQHQYQQANQHDMDLIVIMTPSSPVSGELRGYLVKSDPAVKNSIVVNYQHYYALNAIRDKMIHLLGDSWSQVKAVYHAGDLEFHFEYS